MAKRGATEQITKDNYERDSRDSSPEPAEEATPKVLAGRKILKPRSRLGAGGASPSLFNLEQSNSTPTGSGAGAPSLFGQTQPTPSKNIFGQLAPTPNSNPFGATPSQQPSPFPNLFGASTQAIESPAAPTLGKTPQRPPNPFGTPAIQAANSSKPLGNIFGTPAAQTPKPAANPFAASTRTPNGIGSDFTSGLQKKPTEQPSQSLFGFPSAAKPQNFGQNNSVSTTPTATPTKPSLFNLFDKQNAPSSPKPAVADNNKSPAKPLFGGQFQASAAPTPKTDKDSQNFGNLFSAPKAANGNSPFAPNNAPSNQKPLFSSPNPLASTTSAPTPNSLKVSKPAAPEPNTKNNVTEKNTELDVTSLSPPKGSSLTKEDMPAFNWMYQIRSLNTQFLEMVQEALTNDPYSDLSSWAEFYQKQTISFDTLRKSQMEQLGNEMQVDNGNGAETATPSKASRIFESALAPSASASSNSQAPNNSSNLFQTKPSAGLFGQAAAPQAASTSTLFNPAPQTENIFSAASTKPTGIFGNKPAPAPESKSPFIFGSASQTPSGLFDSGSTKENDGASSKSLAPNPFSWTSKNNSAVPSNASSPASVLAGGTAGMKDADAGSWTNPFTQQNPLFITQDDDDDEEGEDDNDEGDANEGDDDMQNADGDDGEDAAPQSNTTNSEPAPIFGAQQPASSSSLFGRVSSSTPIFNFGQSAAPQTGAVSLFGNTTTSTEPKTWTPDKGIKFGNQSENKSDSTAGSAPSIFGNKTQASTGLFGSGSTTSVPSFNFASPSNGNSIFSNPSSKPATPPVLFGGPSGGGLAPPAPLFGGPSPAPSDMSTPGESSNKEGDENEPSDEAGQQGGNSTDFSGRGPGEEEEDEVFEARSSIYNLVKGAYVKIGIGRLRVLKNRNTFKSRVVVKVETGKVLMNVGLRKELDYSKVSETEAKGKVVKVLEFLPGGESRVWVMKVGTVELAQKLRKTLEENK
ncbi:hypothetical protein TWF694_009782 [Orbilia ellipsospora]|uniref:RanBD1 domain-containing protein n=1 Tax=Orbilia ellipsospora TaxID=2528407 RepID=A0AAV9XF05_9PEZI